MDRNIKLIENRISELKKKFKKNNVFYRVPYLWVADSVRDKSKKVLNLNPLDFFENRLKKIRKLSESINQNSNSKEDWTKSAVIYNLFVRYATAFDHYDENKIENPLCGTAFRCTGTFLKTIALLPYIKNLGCNTLYLLPITAIGEDSRKGTLGSPYAVKNPYKLDELLSEPVLELSPEIEFSALVEAAHLLNIKVVVEFVFRTASLDSELISSNPEWFYWIKAELENRTVMNSNPELFYGNPIFTVDEINIIKQKVLDNNFEDLLAPNINYKNMFTDVPIKLGKMGTKIFGKLKNDALCKIPSAFADWPPDDIQPPWDDVTYLKLYDNSDFNYISYNTIRMYDNKLAQDENIQKDLWENISGILPYFIREFDIDGVMIDMGHALPSDLLNNIIIKAKSEKENFVFWEENFTLNKNSIETGYSAVVGYLPFDAYDLKKFQELLKTLETGVIPYFATTETHNTPRTASHEGFHNLSKFLYTINSFIPGLSFIHSGFELSEQVPVNTGLCFTQEEISKYPAEKLPLFSEAALDWSNEYEFTEFIKYILNLREKYLVPEINFSSETFVYINTNKLEIVAFARKFKKEKSAVLIIGNMNSKRIERAILTIPENQFKISENMYLRDLFSDQVYKVTSGVFNSDLRPFQILLFDISDKIF